MNPKHWLSVVVGGLLTVAPQVLTVIPPEYRDVATATVGVIVSAWHLYQPSPTASK